MFTKKTLILLGTVFVTSRACDNVTKRRLLNIGVLVRPNGKPTERCKNLAQEKITKRGMQITLKNTVSCPIPGQPIQPKPTQRKVYTNPVTKQEKSELLKRMKTIHTLTLDEREAAKAKRREGRRKPKKIYEAQKMTPMQKKYMYTHYRKHTEDNSFSAPANADKMVFLNPFNPVDFEETEESFMEEREKRLDMVKKMKENEMFIKDYNDKVENKKHPFRKWLGRNNYKKRLPEENE